MFLAFLLIAGINLSVGFLIGYISRYDREFGIMSDLERETYCHGYEDGFYLGLGEYDPAFFRKEIAEKAYNEYKGIKYGPTKH